MAGKITKIYTIESQRYQGTVMFKLNLNISCTCGAPDRNRIIGFFFKQEDAQSYLDWLNTTVQPTPNV